MMKTSARTIFPISLLQGRLKEEVIWDSCKNGEAGGRQDRLLGSTAPSFPIMPDSCIVPFIPETTELQTAVECCATAFT